MSLGKAYYDPKHPAGSGQQQSQYKQVNIKGTLKCGFQSQNTYTLHEPVRKKFPRNLYTVTGIDIWEMDLADLISLDIQVQVTLKRYKHIFTVCLERASKGQDRYLNHIGFEIYFKIENQLPYN